MQKILWTCLNQYTKGNPSKVLPIKLLLVHGVCARKTNQQVVTPTDYLIMIIHVLIEIILCLFKWLVSLRNQSPLQRYHDIAASSQQCSVIQWRTLFLSSYSTQMHVCVCRMSFRDFAFRIESNHSWLSLCLSWQYWRLVNNISVWYRGFNLVLNGHSRVLQRNIGIGERRLQHILLCSVPMGCI